MLVRQSRLKELLEQALADLREQVLYAAERPLSDEHKRTIQLIYAAVSSEEPEASVHSALAAIAPAIVNGQNAAQTHRQARTPRFRGQSAA